MEIIYSKLAKLELSTQSKIEAITSIRHAFFKMDKEKIRESTAEFAELMKKIQVQSDNYSIGYSIMLSHLDGLSVAFRNAEGYAKSNRLQIYIKMRQIKDAIATTSLLDFRKMQGEADSGGVCRNTAYARDVMWRFHDPALARWLRTEPTGHGEKGRKRVVELFERRIGHMEKVYKHAAGYYEQGISLINDIRQSMETFWLLRLVLKRQLYTYQSNPAGENFLVLLKDMQDLFNYEATVELKNVTLVKNKKSMMKDILASTSLLKKDWARTKNDWYSAKLFWEKRGEQILFALDLIAVATLFISPPIGTLIFGGTLMRKVGKATGLFGRVVGFFKRESKFVELADEAIKVVSEATDMVGVGKEVVKETKEVVGKIEMYLGMGGGEEPQAKAA